MVDTVIRNETPSRLTLIGIKGDEMSFSPLQIKEVSEDSGFDFDDLIREGVVKKINTQENVTGQAGSALLGMGVWAVIISYFLARNDPLLWNLHGMVAICGLGNSLWVAHFNRVGLKYNSHTILIVGSSLGDTNIVIDCNPRYRRRSTRINDLLLRWWARYVE